MIPGGRAPEYIRNDPDCPADHQARSSARTSRSRSSATRRWSLAAARCAAGRATAAYPALAPDVARRRRRVRGRRSRRGRGHGLGAGVAGPSGLDAIVHGRAARARAVGSRTGLTVPRAARRSRTPQRRAGLRDGVGTGDVQQRRRPRGAVEADAGARRRRSDHRLRGVRRRAGPAAYPTITRPVGVLDRGPGRLLVGGRRLLRRPLARPARPRCCRRR